MNRRGGVQRGPVRRPWGRGRRGVSIFEILIAFIVLQTGLLISVQALIAGKARGVQARKATYATLVAQARLDYLVREVVPTLAAGPGAGTASTVPEQPEPVVAPADVGEMAVDDLQWQGVMSPAGPEGLYDVVVEVSYHGLSRRRQSVTLATRTFVRPQ